MVNEIICSLSRGWLKNEEEIWCRGDTLKAQLRKFGSKWIEWMKRGVEEWEDYDDDDAAASFGSPQYEKKGNGI